MATDIADTIVGFVYIAANGVALPLYVGFLCMFAAKDPYRSSTTFRIMFALGVLECFQMLSGIQAGVMTLLDVTIHDYFEIVGGAFNCMVLFGRPLFLLILAINRFVTIINLRCSRSLGNRIFQILVGTTVFVSVAHFAYRLTKIGKAEYSLEFDLFRPPVAVPGTLNALFRNITVYSDVAAVLLTSSIDLCIFVFVVVKRKRFLSTDFPVIFQGIVTLGHVMVVKCGSGDFYGELENRVVNVIFILWLEVMSISNPVFYLLCVRSLRSSFLEFVGLRESRKRHFRVNSVWNTSSRRPSDP